MKIGDWTIGSDGLEVGTFSIRDGTAWILAPATQVWAFTLKKIKYQMDVYSLESLPRESENLIRSTLVTQSIAMLVNGMEVYAKARFAEMEKEGKQPDRVALLDTFSYKQRREQLEKELEKGKSITQALLDHDLIKFHNWKNLRCAYLTGYKIDINTLQYTNANLVELIRTYIRWRHRITHAAEELTILNIDDVHTKRVKPIFATKETLETVKSHFVDLIETIDRATKQSG